VIRRIIHIVFFLFLLALFGLFLSYTDNRKLFLTSTPTSTDQGQHGLALLNQLISQASGKIEVIRSDYHMLNENQVSTNTQNNLLFLSLPTAIPANPQELASLTTWVANGNHVVAMLALDNAPHWLNKQNRHTIDAFLAAFKLQLTRLDTGHDAETQTTAPAHLISQLKHPVTKGVKQVKSNVLKQDHVWQLRGESAAHSALILLREPSSLSPVAWLTSFGKGNLFLFTQSGLFSNANITNPDNLLLANNIIDYALGQSASIYFDDVHHIVSITNHSPSPYTQPAWVLLVGTLIYALLLYLLNNVERRGTKSRPTLTQFISNNAAQLSRTFPKSEAAVRYANLFFNDARTRLDLPANNQPIWEDLQRQKVHKRLLRKACKTYQLALMSKRINLNKFIHRLDKLRSQLK